MSVGERDPHSGHMTTGHEWNGIKELNTPVPRVVYISLSIFFLFALGYWLLMPAWPIGTTYTKGLLGQDERRIVTEKVERAALERSVWTRRVAGEDHAAILADGELMARVREDGHRLFGDNCSACHGADAAGGPGFPNLVDRDWLWGGTPESITRTVHFGVNNPDAESRVSQMMAFGRDGLLDDAAIRNVTAFVMALSDPARARGADAAAVQAGREVFAANCVSCHGANGRGDVARGIPNLADRTWLYGGDAQAIYTSIDQGRLGEMPAWRERLTPLQTKILVLYLLDRGRRTS
ncbi:MAG: cytochrome-c oxidase, cbb3-type subunit III [Allosphingosinicella sp.]